MAQGRPDLQVEARESHGSRFTRRLRREGVVPGIVYGAGGDCQPFQANARELQRLLSSGAAVFDLQLDGTGIPVIVKDQQLHPVRGEVMHIDMLRVNLNETIQTTVLVEVHGAEEAPGVKEGGVLEQVTRELNIDAPEGVTFLDDPAETVIATITIPTEVPEEEIEEETGLVAEGEADASDED